MNTHRFDLIAFVFGALFAALGVIGLTEAALLTLTDLRWIGPAVLVLLGVALVVSAARREPCDEDGPPTDGGYEPAAVDASGAPEDGEVTDRL